MPTSEPIEIGGLYWFRLRPDFVGFTDYRFYRLSRLDRFETNQQTTKLKIKIFVQTNWIQAHIDIYTHTQTIYVCVYICLNRVLRRRRGRKTSSTSQLDFDIFISWFALYLYIYMCMVMRRGNKNREERKERSGGRGSRWCLVRVKIEKE